MEDLYALGKQYLGKIDTAISFIVNEGTVLVNRAPQFQTRIKNVVIL